jgi:hypothetical protein
MNKMSPVPAFRRSRTSVAILLAYLVLFAPLAQISAQSVKVKRAPQSTPQQPGKGKAGEGGAKNLTLPNLNAPAATGPVITATKDDSFPDPDNDGKALPGDTITYTVTVKNTGDANATGVTFNDSVDTNTTLVAGSVQTQPIANNDTYAVLGNVDIQPNAANGLLANDCDPDNGPGCSSTGLTPTGPSTTTQGGNITINADGSFTYNPAPGFTGTDTVTYTVTDGSGKTDTAVATFNVAGMIWFVKSDAATNGDGRLTSPFNCLRGPLCFDSTTTGGAADDIGDNIFLYASATSYNGGLTLLNTQKIIGQGATGTLDGDAGVTLPPNSDPTFPTLNSNPTTVTITTVAASTNGINIAAGNSDTLRGFTVGNTTGAKIASPASPPALAFGTLSVSEVILNGTGQALNLDNGTLAATFVSIDSTTSGAQGINLDQISGSLTATNGTTITNPVTQCILVTASNANMSFGNTSCSDATDGISLQNNANTTTRSFGTLTVTGTNTGSAFLHSNGGGNTTISGAASLISVGNPVDIQNMAASTTVNFAGGASVTKSTAGGAGVNLATNNATSNVTFSALSITTSNGTGLSATGGGTLNVTNATGSISATGVGAQTAPAILANGVALNANFSGVSCNGSGTGGNCISLTNVTGTSNFGTGSLTGAAGATFLANGGTATVTYNGTITQGNAARVVDVQNKTGGTLNFGGAISSTGGTGTGIFLNVNTGATINFTGGINLTTNANAAFTATGGGTVNATQNNGTIVNTLTTTTGTALNVANTNIGASGLTFRSISANGGANGIVLNTTGAAGGLTVTGNSSGACGGQVSGSPLSITTAPNTADCTGGTIQSTTSATNGGTDGTGIRLTSTSNVSLTRMHLTNHANYAIGGTSVTALTLNNCLIDGVNGSTTSPDEGSINITNLLGTSAITNSTVRGGFEDNIEILNNTGTGTLTISGSAVRDNSTTTGDDGVFGQADPGATFTLKVLNSVLQRNRGDHVNTTQSGNGVINTVVTGNTMTFNGVIGQPFDLATTAGGSVTLTTGANFTGTSTFNVSNNNITGAKTGPVNINNTSLSSTNTGIFSGTISGNIIGKTGAVGSGSDGDGIDVTANGNANITVSITNNDVRQWKLLGINLVPRDGAATMNATVTGNAVGEPFDTVNSGQAILFNGGPATTETGNSCVNIGGAGALANSFPGPFTPGILPLRVRQRAVNTVSLPGYAGGNTDTAAVAAYLSARNNNVGTTATVNSPPGGGFVGGAACTAGAAPSIAPPDKETTPAPESASVSSPVSQPVNDITSHPFVSLPQLAKPAKAAAQIAAAAPQVAPVDAQPPVSKSEGGTKGSSSKTSPVVINGAGGTVSVSIGTLAPGDSVTITFQVVVDNPYSGGPNVSNQGTVSGTNFANVQTDDPSIAGPANATLTPIKVVNIRVNDAKVSEPTTGTAPMLFTVTLSSPAPAGGVSVNFATANDGSGTHPATGGAACGGTVDYETTSNTLNFAQGESVRTIPVNVCADTDSPEPDETFLLNLSGAVGGIIVRAQAVGTITQGNAPGTFIISELRTSGPGGAGDDFVELYNNTGTPLTVTASDTSGGYGVYKMGTDCNVAPVLVGIVPNGTSIPARGHFLLTGSNYSLANYGGTNAATGDAQLNATPASPDIETDHNVAVFSTADVNNLSTASMLDAVGFGTNTGGAVCDLLREGTTLPPIAANATTQHTFFRNLTTGLPQDTNDNAADFMFADTQGTFISGVTQRLGAPGPENKNSPILRSTIKSSLLDANLGQGAAPNRVRDLTSNPGNNSTFGTLSIRRRFTNNTGAAVTRLRFRVVTTTTFPSPGGGVADVRLINSTSVVVNGITDTTTCSATGTPTIAPCSVTVQGTTLEQPPTQPNGGGYNSTAAAGVITTGTPLAPGASINLQFLLGLQTTGNFAFLVIVEALP